MSVGYPVRRTDNAEQHRRDERADEQAQHDRHIMPPAGEQRTQRGLCDDHAGQQHTQRTDHRAELREQVTDQAGQRQPEHEQRTADQNGDDVHVADDLFPLEAARAAEQTAAVCPQEDLLYHDERAGVDNVSLAEQRPHERDDQNACICVDNAGALDHIQPQRTAQQPRDEQQQRVQRSRQHKGIQQSGDNGG